MNGGLTWQDLDTLKAKAAACDAALLYLAGRCDSEPLMMVERILCVTPDAPTSPLRSDPRTTGVLGPTETEVE